MPGGTLAERLATDGPLSPAAARRLALDLLAALGAAHERGIVHRDVKPANIFFDAAGNAKLGDFGGAHLADFGQTQTGRLPRARSRTCRPSRSAARRSAPPPISTRWARRCSRRSPGRPPFLGPDLVGQHLGEAPPPADRAARRRSRRAHDQTLLRALAKAPADRFGSAGEMAEAVAAWPVEEAAVAAAVPKPSARTRRRASAR